MQALDRRMLEGGGSRAQQRAVYDVCTLWRGGGSGTGGLAWVHRMYIVANWADPIRGECRHGGIERRRKQQRHGGYNMYVDAQPGNDCSSGIPDGCSYGI